MATLNTEKERAPAVDELRAENEELRRRLEEAEETIHAIQTGAVDALVVAEPSGHRVYTLEGADRPYRLFVEEMHQGAATLYLDGTIAWCNRQLADLLKTPAEKLIGAALRDFVSSNSLTIYENLLWQGQTRSGRGEAHLQRADGGLVPAYLTFNALPADCGAVMGVLITDLTTQRHHEQLTAAYTALRESEERLTAELAATRQLQEISTALIHEGDTDALYQKILDAASRVMHSDMASMQMVDEGDDALRMLAWRGFDPEFAEIFALNRPETRTSCSVARRTGQRVVVPDVETCDFIAGTPALADHRKTGIRAVQSTPLISRGGRLLGIISTHWRQPHQPTKRDLRLLDILARQAADLMERKEAEHTLRESERRFREMIDALPAAIYTTDAEGRLTHFNPAAVEFSGRVPELGTDHWCVSFKLYHADGTPLPHDQCPMAIALKEGRVFRGIEAIVERPDGTRRWFTPYPTPLRDRAGRIVGGINMLLDITERKQAEEARARLAAIVDSSDDAIISKTLDGVIVSWNVAAERLLGYPAAEIVGQHFGRLIPPERQDEEIGIVKRLRRGERVEHFETVRIARNGQRREVSLSISPIRDGTGRVIGASKIMRDITERKRAEEALHAAQAELQQHTHELETRVAERTADLQETNEQLEAFAHSIAHDLRSPLRSMAGFSKLLLDQHAAGLDERGRSFLRRIQDSSEFMDKLLLDLLAYGRTARAEMKLGRVEVRKAWEDALAQTAHHVEKTGARVDVAGPFPAVLAHEATLGQCLANLLSNAMKFVAPGVQPRIRFRAEEIAPSAIASGGRTRIRLWVEDNGIGIPPEQQERAFRVFERLHGARYAGTGVGLSIVRKGAERMGGQAGLESEPDKGSRFWIELEKAD